MAVNVAEITWRQLPDAAEALAILTADDVAALRAFLCSYFSMGSGRCIERQGKSISPIASHAAGAKGLKVRWAYPGSGKSGGLRLAVAVYCDAKIVTIAGGWDRKSDPDDAEFAAAFSRL